MATYNFADVFPAFARGSDAYAVGSNGLLQLFTLAQPRFQYSPTAAFIKGLLIEAASSNIAPNPLLAQSPVGTVTSWTNASGLTVDVDATGIQGMTGRTGLTRIVDTNPAATSSLARNNIAITADGSFYIAKFSFKKAPLLSGNTAEIPSLVFNMAGGGSTIVVFDPNISNTANLQANCKTTSGANAGFGLIQEANGAYSIWVAMIDTGATSYTVQLRPSHNSSTDPEQNYATLFAATGGAVVAATGNLFVDWAQVEKRSVPYPSSYMLTSRNAEVAEVTGTKFSEFFPQDGTGAVSIGAFAPNWAHGNTPSTEGAVISFNDGTGNEVMRIARSGTNAVLRIIDGGVTQTELTLGTWPNGALAKMAFSYQANNIIAAINGNTAVVDLTATLPTVTKLSLGMSGVGGQYFGSEIGYVRFYENAQDADTVKNLTI